VSYQIVRKYEDTGTPLPKGKTKFRKGRDANLVLYSTLVRIAEHQQRLRKEEAIFAPILAPQTPPPYKPILLNEQTNLKQTRKTQNRKKANLRIHRWEDK